MILDKAKHYYALKGFDSFFWQCFALFNITEQTALVQADVYVKLVSWGSLYISYTLVTIHISHQEKDWMGLENDQFYCIT